MKNRNWKTRAGLITIACLIASVCCLAACSPQQQAAPKADAADTPSAPAATTSDSNASNSNANDSKDTTQTMTLPGDFQNKSAGDFTDTEYNRNYLNDGNRGCNSCHTNLWDQMHDLSPIQHVLSSGPGYGQTYNINDCLTCHRYNLPCGGPRLGEIIHNAHYTNPQFTDVQNGTCWSCHASTIDGDLVLYDEYKYTAEFGGYNDSGSDGMHNWLGLRTWRNGSVLDVVADHEPNISVTISQPVSDEADMFIADNYIVPELSADTWKLTVTGANEEKTFTLADLQAMPQTEITVTQDCMTNAVNGVMIGNFPVKGVLVKDFIEACGGLPEGVTSMSCMGTDKWGHTTSVDWLLEQGALIGLEYWGHPLTVDQGFPATLVIPGIGGAFWDKWLDTITFGNVESAVAGSWQFKAAFPDGFQGIDVTGWFTPGEDGEEFKVGQAVPIDGYAFMHDNMGHVMTSIAFSSDYGTTWTTFDMPADFDQKQWIRWEGTWTPETAGTYVLWVKAIDSEGVEPYRPAAVIVKVTE